MESGAVNGEAAMIDGILDRIAEEMGRGITVVATGAEAELVIPYCRHEIGLEPALVMTGLKQLYDRNTHRSE